MAPLAIVVAVVDIFVAMVPVTLIEFGLSILKVTVLASVPSVLTSGTDSNSSFKSKGEILLKLGFTFSRKSKDGLPNLALLYKLFFKNCSKLPWLFLAKRPFNILYILGVFILLKAFSKNSRRREKLTENISSANGIRCEKSLNALLP